jgi:hypothetical protein
MLSRLYRLSMLDLAGTSITADTGETVEVSHLASAAVAQGPLALTTQADPPRSHCYEMPTHQEGSPPYPHPTRNTCSAQTPVVGGSSSKGALSTKDLPGKYGSCNCGRMK